jgi:hypothetical protein
MESAKILFMQRNAHYMPVSSYYHPLFVVGRRICYKSTKYFTNMHIFLLFHRSLREGIQDQKIIKEKIL